jgi:hypothetical protein
MPPQVCPNCKHVNPEPAVYCYHDGALLSAQPGAVAPTNRLSREFFFPSGRRCQTFDEFVSGCQEEWAVARELLQRGMFGQYFASLGRMDLVRASQEAQALPDHDIGLTNFLGTLPVTDKLQGPKLDLKPRKLDLGRVRPGDSRQIDLRILNRGQGTLQGSVTVIEGNRWLHLGVPGGNGQCAIHAPREQVLRLTVDTRGLSAATTYGGKLRIITNGGVDEVPIQVELQPHAFQRPPFHGAKTPRELAQKMRDQPKAAVPLLETGEVARWFASNGWNYPITGQPAPGVAGVQQFFEAMGLSKPPTVQLSQPAVRVMCVVPERPRFQIALFTQSKKWVYGNVATDVPWLAVLTPAISGAKTAPMVLEVEPRNLPAGNLADGMVQVLANGNQRLLLRVVVDIMRPRSAVASHLLQPLVTLALACLLIRLLLAPVVDFYARPQAVSIAAKRTVNAPEDSPARSIAGWLQLPWTSVLLKNEVEFPDGFFGAPFPAEATENFRDYFVSNYVRIVASCTWWIGAVLGALVLLRRNGWQDGIWGLVCGGVLGLVAAASVACIVLLVEILPLAVWGALFGTKGASLGMMFPWVLFAVMWWALIGLLAGLLLLALGPLGKMILTPIQDAVAGIFRLCGLRGLAKFCAAN